MKEKLLDELSLSIVELNLNGVKEVASRLMEKGVPVYEAIKAIATGLEEVGAKYEKGEYFLSELVAAGVCATTCMEIIKRELKSEQKIVKGTVVIGTVEGDIHDIGKNIMVALLRSAGFDVYDLGVDVPPEKFAQVAKERRADIVGISCLLTVCLPKVKETVEAIHKSIDPQDRVKIIVGGRAVCAKDLIQDIYADAYTGDAIDGLKKVKKLTEKGKVSAWKF